MIIWVENYSGSAGEVDIDGSVFNVPMGRNQINLDETMLMGGEAMVTWDPAGMMMMDTMDADDVLTADSMGNVTFHSLEAGSGGSEGTLVPYDTFMMGLGGGGVMAASVMMFVIVKKVLLQNHNYD